MPPTEGNHEACFDFGVAWTSLQGFNTRPIGLQKQMVDTHRSDFGFQPLAIWSARTEHACRKGESKMLGDAPVPEMPSFSAWISSPGGFEDYVHLTKIFQ